jgi:uncharacterized protein (TIGR03435 family)
MTGWVGRIGGPLLVVGVVWMAVGMPRELRAQTAAAATPAFEVATIRPSDPNKSAASLMMSNDKFETEGQTLKSILKFAYNLNMGGNQQISGGPAWVGLAKFDITAKEDAETAAALNKLPREERVEKIRVMVQELLAERFKLKVHHETKELPVYAMTVAKSGVKMTPVAAVPVATDGTAPARPQGSGIRRMGAGQMQGINTTPELLANVLGSQPEIGGRMVLDKTELAGKYDFMLKWTPDAGMGGAGDGGASPAGADASGPGLFTALQEQLGLKLDATKGMVDTIVIDSVEMLSEN